MLRRLFVLLGWLLGLLFGAVVLFWLVLSSPMFSDSRRSIVERVLSDEIGQALVVNDDVRVRLGRIARVYLAGVEIPSENIEGVNLAELRRLELDVNLVSLARGKLDIDHLTIDGLLVNAIRQQDGATSWTPTLNPNAGAETISQASKTNAQTAGDSGGILNFLNDKTASFTAIRLKIDNQDSGFSFDFDLSSLLLEQLEGRQLVSLTSKGTVNGEAFSVDGEFPRGLPFATSAVFGELRLDFDGRPLTAEQGGGFLGTLTLDTGEIGEVLDILKLDRVLEGIGRLSTDILSQDGVLKIEDLKIDVSLADGSLFSMNGKVGNLLESSGFDLLVDARLHPENQPPLRAVDLQSLELTGITAHVISKGVELKFEDLIFLTNAFDQELKQVGPVSIGRIRRTPEGQLSLLDISFQMGPLDAPYVVGKGELTNVLQLKGLEITGKLTSPASLVLPELPKEEIEQFGRLSADFAITDASGNLSLTRLDAYTEGTDLWSLKAHSSVPDVTSLEDLTFNLDLDVADAATFLAALDLKPVDAGAIEFTVSAKGQEHKFLTSAAIAVGDSRLSVGLDTVVTDGHSVVRGAVKSARLRIDDLLNGAASALEIATLSQMTDQPSEAAGDGPTAGSDEKIEEPLVLGSDDTEAENFDVVMDSKREEPLVIGTAQSQPSALVDPVEMLAKLDLEIGIEIDEITGQLGVTKVSSNLEIKDAKAQFGPFEFSYDGGHFNLSAAMDLIKSPDLVTVSGATNGWDLGEILAASGVDIDARGKLRARFNITGSRKSAKAFVNSVYGSATVSMANGAIASSLLELAGLGIFPWLFSAELNQGYTNIACAVAPLKIQAGKISSNSIVVETKTVQMVITGTLDWKRDTISMRAEPRPVGRPLARSAWPFSVTGALSKPKITVHAGGARVRRADGAAQSPAKRKPCTPDIRQLE